MSIKGKEPVIPRDFLLPNPSTGSANPAASLSSLWVYLEPALNHILKSATNNLSKAPSIDLVFYSGIHSACYTYITSQSETQNSDATSGTDLYDQLDRYLADTSREILLGAPNDDSTLIRFLLPCFSRYSNGAHSLNRLLSYVNRHYVKRAIDEDKGWLTLHDILLEDIPKTTSLSFLRDRLSSKLKAKRLDELQKWGYVDGDSVEVLARAEASAEAASSPERIVPIVSLAHRRFRTEVIEPLLAKPKTNGKKAKKKRRPNINGNEPKGRLARAVKDMLESKGMDEEERLRLAQGLASMLRTVGVHPEQALRRKLDQCTTVSR